MRVNSEDFLVAKLFNSLTALCFSFLKTFEKLLQIHNFNHENFDLEFSFVGTGAAKIKKLNDNLLINPKKIISRKMSIKNFFRKFIIGLKK